MPLRKGEYVNPARAGMIPRASPAPVMRPGKPRASGDDPVEGLLIEPPGQ